MPAIENRGIRARLKAELDDLRGRAQLRTLEEHAGIQLGSNDYLGFATAPRLKQAVIESVERAGRVASTGSRLLSGHSEAWEQVEAELAAFAGAGAALYFNSGYAANIGLLTSVLTPGDTAFSDSLNHASIIDGIRLSGARKAIYPHLDLDALEAQLKAHQSLPGEKIVVTESLFSMDGDRAPLGEIFLLAQRYGADLIVDEAHATGVFGPSGRGLAAEAGIATELLAAVHTCGKALASMGAFVCGNDTLKRYLINRARTFIFSTAAPPYMAGQISAALEMTREADSARAHLASIAELLRSGLREADFDTGASTSQIVPVMLGPNEVALHFAEHLRANGFAIRAVRPPTVPAGTARLRLSLTSKISRGDIQRLLRCIIEARESSPAAVSAHSHV